MLGPADSTQRRFRFQSARIPRSNFHNNCNTAARSAVLCLQLLKALLCNGVEASKKIQIKNFETTEYSYKLKLDGISVVLVISQTKLDEGDLMVPEKVK